VYAPRHGKYGYEFYELYRREDAVPKLERKPRDYNSIFEKRYPDRQSALKDAAEALFNLNRYAKHETCADDHQALIYELKNRFIEYLWQMGYCTESVHIRSVPIEYECFRCEGSGIHWESGEDCRKCQGTGIYRTKTRPYWAIRFVIDGREFAWHQPEALASWARPIGEQVQHDVEIEEKPVALPALKFAEAKALIAWTLHLNVEELKTKIVEERKQVWRKQKRQPVLDG
jgi:hypothetical protein